jgi:hypothetical protein
MPAFAGIFAFISAEGKIQNSTSKNENITMAWRRFTNRTAPTITNMS